VLRRAWVISREDAADLDRAHGDAGRRLQRLATLAAKPLPGLALVRWYPVWLVAAAVVPGSLLFLIMRYTLDDAYRHLMHDLGIALPRITEFLLGGLPLIVLGIVGAMAGMAGAIWFLGQFRVLRHVLHLWCPEVHRADHLLRLIAHARRDQVGPAHLGRWRSLLAMIGWKGMELGAWTPGAPVWDADWRTWMLLTRFRLSSGERSYLRELPALPHRLRAIGVLPAEIDDFEAAEDLARERLARAVAAATPLLVALLYAIGIAGLVVITFLPLFRILENISSVGGM
nr:hypothetical protein [Planctomycetota bacterium]